MIRVVLDTNVTVSAFITGRGNEWRILDKVMQGELMSLTSDEIIKEFDEVISRPKFGYTRDQVECMKLLLIEASQIVVPETKLDVVWEDPSDNRVLECGVTGDADFIVSGDRHLLELREIEGTRIVDSREFIRLTKNL